MKSELCKSCIHTNVCGKDKNLIGDNFVLGHPVFFDNDELFRKYKEREAAGFPCEDYMQERKHGKWKVITVDNYDLAYGGRIYVPEFKCNQCCSYYESYVRWDEPIMLEDADFPKYCPNCGARMVTDDV